MSCHYAVEIARTQRNDAVEVNNGSRLSLIFARYT